MRPVQPTRQSRSNPETSLRSRAMKKLFTIGYEGAELADFLAELIAKKVDVLVDVRELPLSRRKGFSKTPLAKALARVGIDYRHEKALGAPREIRHQLRRDGNLASYFHAFDRYLSTQVAALEGLIGRSLGSVALLCFERDYTACHRSSVARELARLAHLVPEHLEVAARGKIQRSARLHSRQGVSAA